MNERKTTGEGERKREKQRKINEDKRGEKGMKKRKRSVSQSYMRRRVPFLPQRPDVCLM